MLRCCVWIFVEHKCACRYDSNYRKYRRARRRIPELGGKSALVVFDDVDTDAAVKTVMNGLLTNGGQICTAHSRLIVHEKMAPKLLPALKDALEQVEFATSPLEDVEALPMGQHVEWQAPAGSLREPVH